jgi:hypothetical protein
MKIIKYTIGIWALFIINVNCWSKEYSIINYGAVPDGTTICTSAIQSAINDCANSGGGRVVIPSGKYLSGTILLKSNVEIHFEHSSTLLGSPNGEDYPTQPVPRYRSFRDERGFRSLIYAEGQSNIALTGSGTIDGQGKNHPMIKGQDDENRPKNIMFVSCQNIKVEGLHLTNSAFWNQHYLDCEDVIVRNISVYNHCNYNNDAIDIDGCRRFVLSDCILDSDDDGITIKSTGTAPSEDIVITNCIVSSFCNAIKAGTESTGGFRNITISNCVVKPSISQIAPHFNTPRIGITGISLMVVDGGTMEGIAVNNITIYGTMAPLYVRLGNRARQHTPDAPKPLVGKVRNISISNVVAYGAGSWGSSLTGIPENPVKNISLNNIQLYMSGGIKRGDFNETVEEAERKYPQPSVWGNLPASGLYIRHAEDISIDNLVLGVEDPDERVPIVADDVSNLRITRSRLLGYNSGSIPFIKGKDMSKSNIEKPLGWQGTGNNYIQTINE